MRPRPSQPVCQLCAFIRRPPAARRSLLAAAASISTSTSTSASTSAAASAFRAPALRRQPAALPRVPVRAITTAARKTRAPGIDDDGGLQLSSRIAALKTKLAEAERHIRAVYDSPRVEPEALTLRALDGLEDVAQQAISIRSRQPPPTRSPIQQSSAGAILSGLGSDDAPNTTQKPARTRPLGLDELPSPAYLSRLAEDLIRHPNVFISPNVLSVYIHLQRLLARPRTIPEALYLYANKPTPIENSSPPKFARPSPKSAKQAIPADLADKALAAAIDSKDISLALDVVDHTYRAPAWRRHRTLTKLGLPSIIAGVMPLALYMIAQELSVYSGFIDPWTFKIYAFAGMSTYVMCTGTLGFVALTTHNDHHDRVVWRPGVPLLDRYLREDERAALDRIACAWGFKELWKRGDEEGEDWEGLRQWVLLRGMVLDKPELMPGMNPGR